MNTVNTYSLYSILLFVKEALPCQKSDVQSKVAELIWSKLNDRYINPVYYSSHDHELAESLLPDCLEKLELD